MVLQVFLQGYGILSSDEKVSMGEPKWMSCSMLDQKDPGLYFLIDDGC
jgi:hypothetical protein